MNVAVYCRVSTEGQSLEQQVKACEDFCNYKLWKFDVFAEVGSGKDFKRPKFYEMLQGLRQNKFQAVVCFRLDRLGRNTRDLLDFFEEMKNRKV